MVTIKEEFHDVQVVYKWSDAMPNKERKVLQAVIDKDKYLITIFDNKFGITIGVNADKFKKRKDAQIYVEKQVKNFSDEYSFYNGR